jgi:hypothetical protein
MSNYQIIVKSRDELNKYMNDPAKFTSIMRHDLPWIKELGFIECSMYPEEHEYSRNYYKIFGDEILMLHLRTQNLAEGKFDIRKKMRLINNEEVIKHINSPANFINAPYGIDVEDYFVKSDDIDMPSILSYLTICIERFYYDISGDYKKISKYINVDKIEFNQYSKSDFYLSCVEFMDGNLSKIEVTTDDIKRSGYSLGEFIPKMPDVTDFFDYDKQFTQNMKFLYSALVI